MSQISPNRKNMDIRIKTSNIRRVFWLYPVLVVFFLYSSYFTAWLKLGHPPRALLHDPAIMGLPANILVNFTIYLFILLPAIIAAGIFIMSFSGRQKRIILSVTPLYYIIFNLTVIAFIYLDPLNLLPWFLD
jgi:hypothetical protein